MNKKIVLASQSPRRRELISLLQLPFLVKPSMSDETFDSSLSIEENLKNIASCKTDEVLKEFPNALVIGADTIVVFEDEVLGKPKDEEDAFRILNLLSGNQHEVWTAVSMKSSNLVVEFIVKSVVSFYEMSEKEIRHYIESGEPMDKAGAYNINWLASLYIEKVEGDHYAIMGLPIARVYQEIKNNEW